MVKAAKYYPMGDRNSNTGGRNNRLGSGLLPVEYYAAANRETLIITMAETPEAVENIREIASVAGVDAILVGRSDLTQAMGMASPAQVDAAIQKVIAGTKAEGKAVGVAGAGMTLNNLDRYRYFAGRGVQIFSASLHEFVRRSGAEFLKALR